MQLIKASQLDQLSMEIKTETKYIGRVTGQ